MRTREPPPLRVLPQESGLPAMKATDTSFDMIRRPGFRLTFRLRALSGLACRTESGVR